MPNYRQAPKLYHNKQDFKDKVYYNLPQDLMDCVFTQLDGRSGNQIKLMCVLLGTLGDGSFGVSEAWVCERTGMVQQTYNTARRALIDRGWIYLESGKLFVLPEIIKNGFQYPNGATEQEKEAIKIDTISNCVNNLKKQYKIQTQCEIVAKAQYDNVSQTQCEIVYNKIINRNKDKNKETELSSPNGADNSFQIDGVIDQETANNIVNKTYITPSLILTSTGKYLQIKEVS